MSWGKNVLENSEKWGGLTHLWETAGRLVCRMVGSLEDSHVWWSSVPLALAVVPRRLSSPLRKGSPCRVSEGRDTVCVFGGSLWLL